MTVVDLNEKCLLINHVYCAILPVSSLNITLCINNGNHQSDEKVKIAILFY